MLTLSCPSCGANVNFQSKASVFAVCSFCKSSLVRHNVDLEKIGEMADLQDDLTPLQLGTTGHFGNEKFELIGRLRVTYDDGGWNEWFAFFGDGRIAWLAEAQGYYAMCFPHVEVQAPKRDTLRPGKVVELGSKGPFEVDDMRNVNCVFSEGELPVSAMQGRKSLSVDLSDGELGMGTIEYADDAIRIYVGEYKDFDELKFQNLRHIDGW